tara:strand:+ start:174 stop:383 length:210 start_codon:yes stop_codon:yes gene_type:complete
MKFIIPMVFSLLGGCLPVTVLTGVVSVGDSFLKEMKIEKLDEKIKYLEKKRENEREKRQIDSMLQIKQN